VRPPIPGYERVRTLRTVEDATRLATEVDVAPDTAVVIGAGFIGLEMAENLVGQGLGVTIVEATPQVLPPLDPELSVLVRDELVTHGVAVETECPWPLWRSDQSPWPTDAFLAPRLLSARSSQAGHPPGRTGRARHRAERRYRSERRKSDQRPGHLCRR